MKGVPSKWQLPSLSSSSEERGDVTKLEGSICTYSTYLSFSFDGLSVYGSKIDLPKLIIRLFSCLVFREKRDKHNL